MSSKTQKESAKKTKSARNPAFLAALVLLLAAFSVLIIFSLTRENGHNQDDGLSTTGNNQSSAACVNIGTECIKFETADSNSERIKGLSGRDGLPENGGMLFVFDKADDQCMWMKDMRFSIDMLWLDNDRKILKIAPDVSPATYPSTYCADDSKYVLELGAGTAAKAGLHEGQTLNF